MSKKKISPKIQQAAEKYLASLGSSREQLTDKQWETLAAHIKLQRNRKIGRIVFLLFGIIFASLTVWVFCITKERIQFYVPDDTISIQMYGQEPVISLEPEQIENIIKGYVDLGSGIARLFDFTLLNFAFFGLSWLINREHNKILRVFIPKLRPSE